MRHNDVVQVRWQTGHQRRPPHPSRWSESPQWSASGLPPLAIEWVSRAKDMPATIPTVSPLLTLVTSRNILLLQSLPNSIPDRQDNGRRRKDDTHVGTAARGHVEQLYRFP